MADSFPECVLPRGWNILSRFEVKCDLIVKDLLTQGCDAVTVDVRAWVHERSAIGGHNLFNVQGLNLKLLSANAMHKDRNFSALLRSKRVYCPSQMIILGVCL